MNLILIAIGCGLIAVLYGLFTSRQVLNAPAGNQRMIEVAGAIQEGASAYLRRQYTTIGMVGVAVAILVGIFLGPVQAAGFVLGSLLSGAAGFIGMNISVRANVRTAEAARTSLQGGLTIAIRMRFIENSSPFSRQCRTACRTQTANGASVYGPKSRLATAFGLGLSEGAVP